MESKKKKNVSNWVVFVIGIVLSVGGVLADSNVGALVAILGNVLVLVAIISGIVNLIKSKRKE